MNDRTKAGRHLGLSLGRVEHWHDGLGEFGRQLALGIASRAAALRLEHGLHVHLHLPARWHGMFGNAVGYLDTRDIQRWLHRTREPFALWHVLHQHNRYRPPAGTAQVIETVHDLNFLRQKSPAKAQAYRQRMRRRLSGRRAVVAISRFVADELARELAPLATPLHVIHNGAADLTRVPREPVEGVEPDGFLLHVSRLAPSKNVAALIDLAASWPTQRFVLAGSASDYTRELSGRIDAQGLRNLRLVLDIDESRKAWLYANCRGFLFPSLTEGFGLPPLEAMHFGKPVFLSRLTSLPEVGGDAAFYFDGFEAASMRAVVERGLQHWKADASLAGAATAHAAGFSWSTCTGAYVDLYRALLERGSA
jgi:glycosyltransferase involved in cell wall biosynthesis